jgi:hypothetical protein
MFDKRMPKRILKGSFGGRRPTGKPRNRKEDEVRNMPLNCSIPKNLVSSVKTREIMARKRAEEP